MAAQPSLIDGKPLWLEEATRSGHFFKSKPAAAVLCSRRSTACVRQRERAQPGFERGSAQHPCQRRDWNVIYRMYRAYLSSCIFWSLAVPVASMAMLNGMCERAVTTYVLGSVWWSNKHVKSYSHTHARVHTDQDDLWRGKLIAQTTTGRRATDTGPRQQPTNTY